MHHHNHLCFAQFKALFANMILIKLQFANRRRVSNRSSNSQIAT